MTNSTDPTTIDAAPLHVRPVSGDRQLSRELDRLLREGRTRMARWLAANPQRRTGMGDVPDALWQQAGEIGRQVAPTDDATLHRLALEPRVWLWAGVSPAERDIGEAIGNPSDDDLDAANGIRGAIITTLRALIQDDAEAVGEAIIDSVSDEAE